jgi:hypothetical protein
MGVKERASSCWQIRNGEDIGSSELHKMPTILSICQAVYLLKTNLFVRPVRLATHHDELG